VIPLSFAIFSALCPIVSPVVGSAIAGVTGIRSFGRMRARACTRCESDLARDAATRASEKPRECRIGTLESDSAPPAIMMSALPNAIWSAASVIAWLALAQARLTECASTRLGRCGMSDTSRAMLGASTDGTTVPKMRASTSSPERLVRCSSSATHSRPSSIAESDLSPVPDLANGVRTPATMATRRPMREVMARRESGDGRREGSRGVGVDAPVAFNIASAHDRRMLGIVATRAAARQQVPRVARCCDSTAQ
jgi:hypothetical protein